MPCRHALLILVMILLSGCQYQEKPLLRIGTNIWPGYEAFYLARERHWFDPARIRLVELGSAVDVIDAIRQHRLEGGALTLDEVLLLADSGIDMTVILVCDQSHGADVVMATPDIRTLSDLHGKTIAVETTAVGAIMLESALEAGGIAAQDIIQQHMEQAELTAAWQRGDLDAAVTFEPYKSILERLEAHPVFSSADIPGHILDVLAIRTDVVERHADELRMLVSSYFQARKLILDNDTTALTTINQRLKLQDNELQEAYKGLRLPSLAENRRFLAEDGELATRSSRLSQLMIRNGLLQNPDLEIHVSSGYLP